jgi:glycosyltransferase involved in cell wall biosynthesis
LKLALIVPGGFGVERPEKTIPALSALFAQLSLSHEVHVFAFASIADSARRRHNGETRGSRIHPIEYPGPPQNQSLSNRFSFITRVAARLTREVFRAGYASPFDCFHAFWANESGLLAALLGRALGIPVVVSVGGGEAVCMPEIAYGGSRKQTGRAIAGATFRLADEVTVGTTFARSLLPSSTAGRARIVPLGIDCSQFDAPPARRPGPPWRLLHVASLNKVKDQDTLLDAFAEVAARIGDVSLDCVGEDALGGRVQGKARSLGLAGRVRFHGLLPQDRLVPLYRDAHLHVLSSRYESQAVVVLEAAAAGVPTVGTAVGLLPSLSPEGARCVAPGDAPALADAICALLMDEETRRRMGLAAQSFAREHDAAWTARTFEAIYSELIRRAS